MIRTAIFLGVLGFAFLPAGDASAFWFPECDGTSVAPRIQQDFNWADSNTWRRGIKLVRIDGITESRTVNREGSEVVRRYCTGRAVLSNGEQRHIWYMIEDIGGFAGQTWEVTHCVAGLDPWKNHDGNCRTMR